MVIGVKGRLSGLNPCEFSAELHTAREREPEDRALISMRSCSRRPSVYLEATPPGSPGNGHFARTACSAGVTAGWGRQGPARPRARETSGYVPVPWPGWRGWCPGSGAPTPSPRYAGPCRPEAGAARSCPARPFMPGSHAAFRRPDPGEFHRIRARGSWPPCPADVRSSSANISSSSRVQCLTS